MDTAILHAIAVSPYVRLGAAGAVFLVWLGGESALHRRVGLPADRAYVGHTVAVALRTGAWRGGEDRGSGFVLFVAIYAWAFSCAIGFALAATPSAWPAFYLGIGLAVAGVGLRLWAVALLGTNFSLLVRTSAEQRLVRSGPYRWLRHPSYTAVALLGVAVPLILLTRVGLVVGLLLLPAALGYRIHVEEAALARRFGPEWAAYRESTWRVIPYLW